MKKIYFFFLAVLLFVSSLLHAQVVINEVYGGGGNSGATWKNDFIELYNNGASSVPLTGWSVQYGSSTGTGAWSVTPLSGSIPAHSYYLIQEAVGAGGTTNLPTPDATGSIAMSATAGKVALLSSTTALNGACPSNGSLMDLVGYGSANCSEVSPTAALTNTTSAQRATTGLDNNNNSTDFSTGTPSPTNSSSGVDNTPPTIVSTSPSDNSAGVGITSSLSIVFSESITKNVGVITVHNATANSDDYVF